MIYQLANARELAGKNPSSFRLPSRKALKGLRAGDFVKLIFVFDGPPGGERMWVEIVRRSGEKFLGLLRNGPQYAPKVRYGDPILFGTENILQVMRQEELESTGTEAGNVVWVHEGCNDPTETLMCWDSEGN